MFPGVGPTIGDFVFLYFLTFLPSILLTLFFFFFKLEYLGGRITGHFIIFLELLYKTQQLNMVYYMTKS